MRRPSYRVAKPFLDAALTLVLLLLAAPLMAAVALAVRARLGRPILFRQVRPGRRGEPFVMYKFRTMAEERDASGRLRPDAERLTPFGRLLRRSSLDELPELFNVLKGDMSLVGPRPLLMEYLDRYSADQARRHEVKPGITGWAQVNGRNAVPWHERFARDVFYVDHVSLWLDVRILVLTAIQLWKREGITASGHATMPAFAARPDARPGRAVSSAAGGDR
jgi:lipopolysaccharide/colanic/teichoic acid biosynthesis glycosyltransferase